MVLLCSLGLHRLSGRRLYRLGGLAETNKHVGQQLHHIEKEHK